MERKTRYSVLGAGLIFVTALCTVMLSMAYKQDRMLRQQTYEHASAVLNLIVLTRRWSSDHGGVLVKKRPGVDSNPYLENPDITDVTGSVYTTKNPALMTREISEYAKIAKGFTFHITSLNLKNPENAPDKWEQRALSAFDHGETEMAEVIEMDGELRYRLMKPLYVEKSCLVCHGDQGYKVGNVRGGISVSLPFDATTYALRKNFVGMVTSLVILLILFVLTLYFFIWRLLGRLARQKVELTTLNETKDKFLGMAAHDLRNPLIVVTGLTKLLQKKIMDRSQAEILYGILASSRRMSNLINNLLDMPTIRNGCLDLKLKEVDVANLIRTSVDFNKIIGQQKNIVLRHEVSNDIGPARLDPERIRQVIDNLTGNAIKYSESGTIVTIGAKKAAGSLVIWVEDQGIGIRQEELSRIFDEYAKTSSKPTAGESSHGLGLAIVKRMVELHGGSIHVASETGKGTRFTLSFPLQSNDDGGQRL
jgi:signal transduction histidine kinase